MILATSLAISGESQDLQGSQAEVLTQCVALVASNREGPMGLQLKLPRWQHSVLWVCARWGWEDCLAKCICSYAHSSFLDSSQGKKHHNGCLLIKEWIKSMPYLY